MSLYRHLRASLGSAHKIVLAINTFVMATVIPVIAKADVIDAPRVGPATSHVSTSHVSLIAVIVLVAVVGFIMIKRRNR